MLDIVTICGFADMGIQQKGLHLLSLFLDCDIISGYFVAWKSKTESLEGEKAVG